MTGFIPHQKSKIIMKKLKLDYHLYPRIKNPFGG
jgi:hypothetical protein